ncbi:MAG: hypothetical protein A2Z21_07035 [Candidatus Fraserbacteria bacterium RBG_16_55_9]|uniref:Uncharacterized protein n=1 Tax=Fraserbacteria sp. (strain RBG_16_55_9) TaxID=1817864 RepID=A0A1F5UTG1_FRAXR|nr:MAG: hypothetical protein A2Z21_07035 [Candidatus Fraserbacteria bacterium RBG_16_55_9]
MVLQGTMLTLTALELENSVFKGWSGCDLVASNSTPLATTKEHGSAPAMLGWTILPAFGLMGLVLVRRRRGRKLIAHAGVLLGLTVMLTACPGFIQIGTQCTITVNADRTVTATFHAVRPELP